MNRKPFIVALAAVALIGCTSAAERAEQEYDMVAANPLASRADKCAAAGKVKAAYLQEGDQDNYELWSSIEGGMCVSLIGD